MHKVTHLDCTLRDGGYYNNWDFKIDLANKYLYALSKINVDYVEIGFRFFDIKRVKGKFAYCDEKFLNKLKIPKNINLAVMINAGDVLENDFYNKDLIRKKFIKKSSSKIKLVRVAAHFHELKLILPMIKDLKNLGYEIGINIMQISNKKNSEISKAIKIVRKMNPKVLYFADSLGSLTLDHTIKIIKVIKKHWKKDIGIHTHDNLGNALRNSMIALKNGVKWIDTTISGMGRGPGNTKTELAIIEFEKSKNKKMDIIPLTKLVNNEFKILKSKFNWGTNPYYYMAGKWGIHPSFVQEMISADFPEEKVFKNLKNLRDIGGHKFSKDLINRNELFYHGKVVGDWIPKEFLFKKKILILANGPNLFKFKGKVEKFIKKNDELIVFQINNKNIIKDGLIDYRIACHTMRILLDSKEYYKSKSPIILPLNRFSDRVKKSLKHIKTLNFGLQVKKNKFEFNKNFTVIPNSLAFSYALGIANSAGVKEIYLAGFDGYKNNHPKKIEMDETIENYYKTKNIIKIRSITPSSYKI